MTSAGSTPAPHRLSILQRAATLIATGFGAGLSPVAPGTAGSLLGLALFVPLAALPLSAQLGIVAITLAAGVLAASDVARRLAREDPSVVVVDEVVGQWLALLLLPLTPVTAGLAFFAFRFTDIVKPWPARDLERLHGGLGIMADDVMAGIYANLLVRVCLLVVPA